MHLHQLKVRNLASLRGEHTVDFDVLAGQDLFAITGETGAGKSTLLNAVALALYGRIYKRQLIQSDLVTLGERDASIELTFSVRGVRYLARWATHVRKKDGSLLTQPRTERFCYQLAEDPTLPPRVLEKGPEEVLSLDFDQFSKCVVLNQGEFARFLTSSFSERRDILEHLYPSDNLEAVSGLAKRKWESVQEKLQRLDVQVHGLNEETLFDVEAARQTEQKWVTLHQSASAKLQELRPWAQGIGDLKGYGLKHSEARAKLRGLQLALAQRTDDFNHTMTQWQAHQASLEACEAQLEKERPILEADVQEAQALQITLTTWGERKKQLQEQEERLLREERRQGVLRQDILAHEKAHDELSRQRRWDKPLLAEGPDWNSWEDLERQIALKEQLLQQGGENLTALTSKGRELAQELQAGLERKERHLQALPPEWRPLTSSERAVRLKEWRDQLARAKFTIQERQRLGQAIHGLDAERRELAPQLAMLALAAENEALKHALHGLTELLAAKPNPDHCPLCAQTVSVALWGERKSQWKKPTMTAHDQLREKQKADERLEAQLIQLNRQLAELPALEAPAEAPGLEEAHDGASRLEAQLAQQELRLNESREQWRSAQAKHHELTAALSALYARRDEFVAVAAHMVGVPRTWSPTLLKELLDERERERRIQEKSRALLALRQQETQLSQEISALSASILKLRDSIRDAVSVLARRQEALASKYPGSTPEARLKTLQEDWRAGHAKGQVLQQENRQKEALLAEARAGLGRAEEQTSQLEVLFADLIARMSQSRPIAVDISEAQNVLTPLLQEVENEIKQHEAKALEASTERGKVATLLQEDQRRREKKAIYEKQQTEAQQEAQRWRRLLDVLGQDDMRTYVLSLVEAALIQQTNYELDKLCAGRYEIQHNAKKGKLVPEFWVIDRWRDGLLRKVTTLSGGETFMVSLAMALALAEMARGRADIDCFFIDEGFGTLDDDSLEDVMEMLQQVRSRGKQIGLITHVKALSQRLPLNLKVSKDARGNSSVGVVWN